MKNKKNSVNEDRLLNLIKNGDPDAFDQALGLIMMDELGSTQKSSKNAGKNNYDSECFDDCSYDEYCGDEDCYEHDEYCYDESYDEGGSYDGDFDKFDDFDCDYFDD